MRIRDSIPDKLYFKIGEVARLAGVPTHVLRYWEAEFSQVKPQRAASGQRLFKREDIELVLRIKELLHGRGYTIAGAQKALEDGILQHPPKKRRVVNEEETRRRLDSMKRELLELQHLLSTPQEPKIARR